MDYKNCICFKCPLHVNENPVDCGCEDEPVYIRDWCIVCPKNSFCDVTEKPWLYQPDD